jgi:hypothetical protein
MTISVQAYTASNLGSTHFLREITEDLRAANKNRKNPREIVEDLQDLRF